MKRKTYLTSLQWIAWFQENAETWAARELPEAEPDSNPWVQRAIAASLPAWQLGETSEGRHLRSAAWQYAKAQDDPYFIEAVNRFIREEQRHGESLGEWLDLADIPRKKRDLGDSLFRFCRHAIPNYCVLASVLVMLESLAEIYYAAVRRLTSCPRLQAECERILRDEVRHIQFQCEHLAFARRKLPWFLRLGVRLAEAGFYAVVCLAVWIAHGHLIELSGISRWKFFRLALAKFYFMQDLMDPLRYAESREGGRQRSVLFGPEVV